MFSIEEGTGFPVIFLHGWGGSTDSFAFVAASLKRSFRTVRFDLAGFGNSPPPTEAWGAEEYARAVREDCEKAGIDEAVFVCHSFGGRVGLALSVMEPKLVRALVLVDSAGIRPKLTLRRKLAVARYRRKKKKGLVDPDAGSEDYRALSPSMRSTFVKVVNEDLTPILPSVTVPTLLIWGKDDRDTPLKSGKMMNRLIPDSALIELDGGHFSYLDSPYTFVRILDQFLHAVARQGRSV